MYLLGVKKIHVMLTKQDLGTSQEFIPNPAFLQWSPPLGGGGEGAWLSNAHALCIHVNVMVGILNNVMFNFSYLFQLFALPH